MFYEIGCILLAAVAITGALPIDPVDRINEIVDDVDNLDAIEQIPGEAKFYRTSTETYDDFVPPRLDPTEPDTNESKPDAPNDTTTAHAVEAQTETLPEHVVHATGPPESALIDGFVALMKIFTDLGGDLASRMGDDDQTIGSRGADGELKTNPDDNVETTTTDPNDGSDGTTEMYEMRTLKRPVISQTVKDVLHAFKALHNWRFTK